MPNSWDSLQVHLSPSSSPPPPSSFFFFFLFVLSLALLSATFPRWKLLQPFFLPVHLTFTSSFLFPNNKDLSVAVRGLPISTPCKVSDLVQKLVNLFETLLIYVEEIPPDTEHKSRFGNPAFRTWIDKVTKEADRLLVPLLSSSKNSSVPSVPSSSASSPSPSPSSDIHTTSSTSSSSHQHLREIREYFISCFGSRERIDYGTGHEAHFAAFLLCLYKVGLVNKEDFPALVLRVFPKYLHLMRNLQWLYWLEPAGSHGVWGLDDYHFLPFLWGASQLVGW
jgi:serine/threonine-protein phosphatase 2A activator